MKTKFVKIINVVADVAVVLILLFSVAFLTMTLTSKKDGISNIFGYSVFTVKSDSMEPTIKKGDIIFSKQDEDGVYEEGDVVSFYIIKDGVKEVNTHRITAVIVIEGMTKYQTKGDSENALIDEGLISGGDILAVWTGRRIVGVGTVLSYLNTTSGFFICIMIPVILLFLYQGYRFIRNLMSYNAERAKQIAIETAGELTEEQKKKAVEEYLASLKAEKEKEEKDNKQS
jgi:signal peptidase